MQRLGKYDVTSIDDLEVADIERIFVLADEFSESLKAGARLDRGCGLVMATLFYEPSTRTRLSFESAMHRLGGAVISSADMKASSVAKGETLADTVRVVASYADLIVVRHPNDGAARVAAEYASVPVINAGDGSREHPTQTLCDLYVLRRKKGRIQGLTVALCGDLKFGRTVHSLIYALARFGANIVAVPQPGMEMPDYVLERLTTERHYSFSTVRMEELKSLAGRIDALYLTPNAPHQMALFTSGVKAEPTLSAAALPALDAFYVTRLQRERFAETPAEDAPYMHFDARALRTSRTHGAVVMHPLPRTSELDYELDADPRAVYFEQAAAGVPVRMGLIAWMLERSAETGARTRPAPAQIKFPAKVAPRCANPSCITRQEPGYLPVRFTLAAGPQVGALRLRCGYCERQLKIDFVGHARSRRYYRFDENLYGYVRRWIDEGSLAVFDSVKQAEENGYEPYRRGPQREIMDAGEIAAALSKLAEQVIADVADLGTVALVGVISRGALLALRLRDLIHERTGGRPPIAVLDVYSADAALCSVDGAEAFEVEGRTIVLVDDVINSGWTVQRAMATLWQRGRPAAVKLAVLIDRGHRSVPIRPNYVGKNIPTARNERVLVRLGAPEGERRAKGHERVLIYSMLEAVREPESAA